jgi:hypothetical protein
VTGAIDEGLRAAITAAGGIRALARALNIHPRTLARRRRVPAYRIVQVEAITQIPCEWLCLDLYRRQF